MQSLQRAAHHRASLTFDCDLRSLAILLEVLSIEPVEVRSVGVRVDRDGGFAVIDGVTDMGPRVAVARRIRQLQRFDRRLTRRRFGPVGFAGADG